jgi:cell division initiation protein
MSYTPVELRHVRVGRSLFGYNRTMVEQVIEEVAESFEATWRERGELADRVEGLEKQIAELRQREHLLTQTLLAAEQAASDVRDRARRESDAVIAEAHVEARAIVRAAQNDRERLIQETRRMEGMLRAALGLVAENPESLSFDSPARETVHHVTAEAAPAEAAPAEAAAPFEGPSGPLAEIEPAPEAPAEPPHREDTREFEPIVLADDIEPPLDDLDEGIGHDEHAIAEPVRIPGTESNDFDWGD